MRGTRANSTHSLKFSPVGGYDEERRGFGRQKELGAGDCREERFVGGQLRGEWKDDVFLHRLDLFDPGKTPLGQISQYSLYEDFRRRRTGGDRNRAGIGEPLVLDSTFVVDQVARHAGVAADLHEPFRV